MREIQKKSVCTHKTKLFILICINFPLDFLS
jgi:hypothetical protein